MEKQCLCDRLLKTAREVFERHRACCGMPSSRAEAEEALTRRRLLQVARGVFAEKGAGATVRDICHAARANVSAVNYHFGSKDGLLAAVLSSVLEDLLQMYPMDGGVPEDADAEDKLFGFVFAFLCRILLATGRDEEKGLGEMLSDAFMHPMPPFEQYADAHRKAVGEFVIPILQVLVSRSAPAGAKVERETLVLMVRSIVAQILMYNANRAKILAERGGRGFTPDELAVVAQHITLFSLGGVKHISEQLLCE
ncbi:CerR family C-terminal domain-containing protein [Desulfovibrio mangrovi]|uniref:TetR/AcrR family transcriptional regulator n=1 Tax=Desulfovibrio mangrovi TaxID=2976983 RepID=UPI0022479B75|nr:CerR family C-terminal domain-containing protein [Desulfovibrio mangrovi]UZP66029.1 CerR family C-terminal domain-containing protein [Desulfovibrio mangrovi]